MSRFRLGKRSTRQLQRFKDRADTATPMGYRKISKPEAERRLEPLVGMVARGEVPLDEQSAEAVAYVLDRHHRRAQRGTTSS